jgi:hypothetical protein
MDPTHLKAAFALLAAVAGLSASTSNLANWKPDYTTPVLRSPPAALEQATRFDRRNSPEEIRQLAAEFFSLIDLNRPAPTLARLLLDM